MKRQLPYVLLAMALAAMPDAPALAQVAPADTAAAFELETIVVTAERAWTPLASSTAAVSRIGAEELGHFPQTSLAEALRLVPGMTTVDYDGLGHAPQLMARGFYGGGEAEYVVVLLNGKPLNDLHTGQVRWDAIPVGAIESIEVVRGGASALWGDAAIGGVINVITRPLGAPRAPSWSLTGGSYGSATVSGDAGGLFGRDLGVFGGFQRTDGFREHAGRTTGSGGLRYALLASPAANLNVSALVQWRDFEEPGALLQDSVAVDRSRSSAFHRFDQTRENSQRLGLDGERRMAGEGRLPGSLTAERRGVEAVRSVALAPNFADTKERVLASHHGLGTLEYIADGTRLGGRDRVNLGVDVSYGTLDSEYYQVAMGPAVAYSLASGQRGPLDAQGSANRAGAAAFAQYALQPVEAVRLSVGVRADWLRDRFEPRGPSTGESHDATHTALSPKAGVNVRYLDAGERKGTLYLTAGRSFKAPTLDQLYDQRSFPVPFPPFSVSTANPTLVPQHGTSLEGGIYQGITLVPGAVGGELSLSAYQMDMRDELDFDLQTLRYVNIGESRHRGIEAGARVRGPREVSGFLNYTLQHAVARSGEDAGNFLKAVPRQAIAAGTGVTLPAGLETGWIATHVRGIYLDDQNTVTMPPYTRVDARLAIPAAGVQLVLDVRNVFDAAYSTTGFPDPSGSGQLYFYPAAGRTLQLGIRR